MALDLHHARLKFCIGSKANVWFFVHPIIPPFHLAYNVFSFVLHTKLGLPHSLVFKVIHWICGEPLHLVGTHFFCCSHGGEWIASHDTIQAKKRLYHNRHPTNTFLPLAIEVFEWLHRQANNFFHQYASMVWLAKGPSGLPLVILCAFYR